MSNTREAGRQVVREMFGEQFLQAMDGHAASGGFCSEAALLAFENAFGDLWARPGLDRRSRSLVTMGMLMALRLPNEFKNHVIAALNNGLSVKEVEEVILHGIPYVGFAAVAEAIGAGSEVIKERGLSK